MVMSLHPCSDWLVSRLRMLRPLWSRLTSQPTSRGREPIAERLKKPPPTSSIANALNLKAVRAATGPAPSPARGGAAPAAAVLEHAAQEQVTQQRPSVVSFPQQQPALSQRHQSPETRLYPSREPTGEPPTVVRQFQITASTDATLQRIIAAYSQATGLKLTNSEFLRAVLHALEPTVAHAGMWPPSFRRVTHQSPVPIINVASAARPMGVHPGTSTTRRSSQASSPFEST